jgi:pimeloyl-ACP methyl ester carboxylesterase
VHAKTRRVEIDGKEARGIVVGPNVAGDQILLAASLTMKPGEYSVKLSAFSESGEERMAALDVSLEPMQAVPLAAMQPPVILLNGFQLACPIPVTSPPSAETFGNLESELNSAGIPVYFFDNCKQGSGDESIEVLAAYLGQVISTLRYTDGTTVQQVDIVAHSMGGLIARAYLAGLQSSGTLQPPANPKVRKLVLIATPNFGSFQAFNIGVQSSEMYPGSAFLWNLGRWNQGGDDLRGVDALAIAGNASCCSLSRLFAPSGPNSGDGVVSLNSASLGITPDP